MTVPHHKGRKRMHLELRDTVTRLMTTDFKQKIIDSVSATLTSVYNIATGSSSGKDEEDARVKKALEDSMNERAALEEEEDSNNPRTIEATLNAGRRVGN